MNWGYKILIFIICFILTMSGMVCLAYKQTNEMVDSDYYGKELKYQELIDAAHNLNRFSTTPLLKQIDNKLLLEIPKGTYDQFKSGKIEFLRNDDQSKDKVISFVPDTSGIFVININDFSSGIYKSRVKWTNGDGEYYREQNIRLTK